MLILIHKTLIIQYEMEFHIHPTIQHLRWRRISFYPCRTCYFLDFTSLSSLQANMSDISHSGATNCYFQFPPLILFSIYYLERKLNDFIFNLLDYVDDKLTDYPQF